MAFFKVKWFLIGSVISLLIINESQSVQQSLQQLSQHATHTKTVIEKKMAIRSVDSTAKEGNNVVNAAPVISPFMFSEILEEGMRSSAVCSVIAGDPPIVIRWLKDGKQLSEVDPHIQVVSINEFISSIIIANISRYHSGNYTCVASSRMSASNFTATMTVKASPIWLLKPSDIYAISGTSVVFDCQTSGYPQPFIRWKYMKTNSALQPIGSEPVSILSSPQMHVLENGSLSIKLVEEKLRGIYICDVSNGVGPPLETSAKLYVHSLPQLRSEQKQITVRKLSRLQFSCIATGSKPLTLEWLKNDNLLNSRDNGYIIREEIRLEEKVSSIVINQAMRNDTGIFTCLAINLYGNQSLDINVIVQEPPDPPSNLHALEIGSRTATLTWSLPFIGNSAIRNHNVEYKRKSDNWFDSYMRTSVSNSITITNLLPMTTYEFRVKVENEVGNSDYSSIISITTSMEAPSAIPRDVVCVPISSKSIRITWNIMSAKQDIIEGFYIGYKKLNSLQSLTYKTIQTSNNAIITNTNNGQIISKYEYIVDSLMRHTKYLFIVQAFNSKGAGPSSMETSIETFANDPPEAPHLKVDSLTTNDATLTWEIPLRDESNQVDGFVISFRDEADQIVEWETVQLTRQHKSYVLRNLKCGTTYIVKMLAFNEVGEGKPSDELRFTTSGKIPTAPDKTVFFTANISSVALHLDKWLDGGCPISHFIIQYKPRLQQEWVLLSNHILPEQVTVIIKELTPGTWHDLLISAKNDAGITEVEYRFATLTTTGSTIQPLSVYDSRAKPSIFEDPMILIPAMCAVVVLIVVGSATAFILLWKSRETDVNPDSYCRHRDNSRSDDLSLNSYSKVPKGDSLYDQQQRVQIYYPTGYATGRVQQQIQHHQQQQQHNYQQNDINVECAASVEPRRMRRQYQQQQHQQHDHIYDVPHRNQSKEMGLNDTKVSSYSLLWSQASSKELLDCVKEEEPNSQTDTIHHGLTSSISSRDTESIYNQSYEQSSSCFHETRFIEELSDVECDRDHPWVTKCSAHHCAQKIGNPIIV